MDRAEKVAALGRFARHFDLDADLMDDDQDWLHGQGWHLPETGAELLEYLGVLDAPRADQRRALEPLVASGKMAHAPAAVREHLVATALLDPEDFGPAR